MQAILVKGLQEDRNGSITAKKISSRDHKLQWQPYDDKKTKLKLRPDSSGFMTNYD